MVKNYSKRGTLVKRREFTTGWKKNYFTQSLSIFKLTLFYTNKMVITIKQFSSLSSHSFFYTNMLRFKKECIFNNGFLHVK